MTEEYNKVTLIVENSKETITTVFDKTEGVELGTEDDRTYHRHGSTNVRIGFTALSDDRGVWCKTHRDPKRSLSDIVAEREKLDRDYQQRSLELTEEFERRAQAGSDD